MKTCKRYLFSKKNVLVLGHVKRYKNACADENIYTEFRVYRVIVMCPDTLTRRQLKYQRKLNTVDIQLPTCKYSCRNLGDLTKIQSHLTVLSTE